MVALSFKGLIQTCFLTWQIKRTLCKVKARQKGLFDLIFCRKVKGSEENQVLIFFGVG